MYDYLSSLVIFYLFHVATSFILAVSPCWSHALQRHYQKLVHEYEHLDPGKADHGTKQQRSLMAEELREVIDDMESKVCSQNTIFISLSLPHLCAYSLLVHRATKSRPSMTSVTYSSGIAGLVHCHVRTINPLRCGVASSSARRLSRPGHRARRLSRPGHRARRLSRPGHRAQRMSPQRVEREGEVARAAWRC